MMTPRHTEPIPVGWKIDHEDWLYRRVRPNDPKRVLQCDRAWVEGQMTYCSEVWEARLIDTGAE
jgi:hypothetical protein